MKLSLYNNIIDEYRRANSRTCLLDLQKTFMNVPVETLGSIIAQEYQRKMKKTHYKHSVPKSRGFYYKQFLKAVASGEKQGHLLRLSDQVDLSPALMARIILEEHYCSEEEGETPRRQKITQLMKDTSLIEDKNLAVEIFICVHHDENYGPISDAIRHSIGFEHEMKLKMELKALGIAFVDENVLRERGYDKTPDVKLEIPVAFDGHIVNWIESKASFGDKESHNGYLKDQYWSYWNRFGPGLVIYWFGFIDELDIHKDQGIFLRTSVPKNATFMDPTS